jgi:hypothetical protein
MKRVFVVVSEHNKQDTSFVIDSLNYVLSLKLFLDMNTIYLISNNAVNLKNGFDYFNLFSKNGPLSGTNKRKTFRFV